MRLWVISVDSNNQSLRGVMPGAFKTREQAITEAKELAVLKQTMNRCPDIKDIKTPVIDQDTQEVTMRVDGYMVQNVDEWIKYTVNLVRVEV